MNQKNRWQSILNFIRNDFWRKLVAIFLTVLLYLAISPRVSKKGERSFSNILVNIELPGDMVMDSSEPHRVKVTLSGNKKYLDELDAQELQIRTAVRSSSIAPGEPYTLRLRPQDVINVPDGMRVETVSPQILKLDLQPMASKKVRITPRYDSKDKLPQDFKIVNTTFMPSEVVLQGSARQLQDVKTIYGSAIPIDEQATHSFDHTCTLNIPKGLRSNHTVAIAQVEIAKEFTEHNFAAVPLLIIQSAERTRKFQVTRLDPETVSVTVRGPKGTLGQMHRREINASISLDNIDKPGTYHLPVLITVGRTNQEVTVKNFQPATARVTVVQE